MNDLNEDASLSESAHDPRADALAGEQASTLSTLATPPVAPVAPQASTLEASPSPEQAAPASSASAVAGGTGGRASPPGEQQPEYTMLLMNTTGHVYLQPLTDENLVHPGDDAETFFVTDTLELKHPELKVTASWFIAIC